jgi:hypothetical protein
MPKIIVATHYSNKKGAFIGKAHYIIVQFLRANSSRTSCEENSKEIRVVVSGSLFIQKFNTRSMLY